jgi:hypothetical protein
VGLRDGDPIAETPRERKRRRKMSIGRLIGASLVWPRQR